MNRIACSVSMLLVLAAAGCDQLGLSPPPAESAPAPAPVAAAPDLQPFIGQSYQALIAAQPQFGPEGLGLDADDAARLARDMAQPAPSWTASGGGAEALVFTGCAVEGCSAGRGVVGVDLATGAAFVGVSDGEGSVELAPNDRVEVLLRLSAPTGRWDDARPQAPSAQAAAP